MEGGKSSKMSHFSKRRNFFFLVYQNGNFLPGKWILRREKYQEKLTLSRQKKIPVTPLL